MIADCGKRRVHLTGHLLRVARAHAKVRQARQNALHELTTRLTQEFDVIAIEDLNVKALSRGRNARSINDAAFGEIRRQLTYKSEWRHKILIEVDAGMPRARPARTAGTYSMSCGWM
jgi:putative transposase